MQAKQRRTPKSTDTINFNNKGLEFYSTIDELLTVIGVSSVVSGYEALTAAAEVVISFTKSGVPYNFPNTNYAFIFNDNGSGSTEVSRTTGTITFLVPIDCQFNYIAII